MNTRTSNAMPTSQPKPAAMPVAKTHPKHLQVMADRLKTDPIQLHQTLKQTVFRDANDSEFLALMVVANEYDLNPILKQLYAFPQKGGGIAPIVSIDGWAKIINRQANFDGVEFDMTWQDESKSLPFSCTCLIYKKNCAHPTKITEYYGECFRPTEPWKNMPCRMIRHKAYIQCGRVAFGITGIYDEDEARDIINVTSTTVPPPLFVGPGETEDTKSESTPAKEDDSPPGAEMPAKTEKAETQQVESEQPTQEEQEQKASPFQSVAAPDTLKGDALLQAVVDLLKKSGCTNAQLTAWARRSVLCESTQAWTDMPTKLNGEPRRGGEASLRSVLKNWERIGPAVKAIEIPEAK